MARQSRRSGSGGGKDPFASHPLTTQLPNLTSRPVLHLGVEERNVAPGKRGRIVSARGLESIFARDLASGDRIRLRSSSGTQALGLGQAKVIQDSSILALEWKVRTANLLDSGKASPTYPQDQPAALESGSETAASLQMERRTRRRQLLMEESLGLQLL